jgi:hypothetical protein
MMVTDLDIDTESAYRTASFVTASVAVLGMLASLGLVVVAAPSQAVAHPRDAMFWSVTYFVVFGVTAAALVVRAGLPRPFGKGAGLLITAVILSVITAFVTYVYSSMLAEWIDEDTSVPRNALVAVLSMAPPLTAALLSGLLETPFGATRLRRAAIAGGIGGAAIVLMIIVLLIAQR